MQTFTPLQYFQIDIANLYGKDKLVWNERLEWFQENQDKLYDLIEEADKPHQYAAAVDSYFKAIKGEVNHHPIALDATSSGTQLLSCLIGDRRAAEYSNVINTGIRRDAYTDLFKLLTDRIGPMPDITRDTLKKAIMTSLYGSSAKPKELFGEYEEDFYDLMSRELPYVWQVMHAVVGSWNPTVDSYGWTMPDLFNVHIKVYDHKSIEFNFDGSDFVTDVLVNAPCKTGKAYLANIIHSIDSLIVREMTALAMHNPFNIQRIKNMLAGKPVLAPTNDKNQEMVSNMVRIAKESGFLSAHILDFLDASTIKMVDEEELQELLSLVPNKPFELLSVHDSFHVLPNYGNDLRRLYIANLTKIAKSNLLQFITNQMPIRKLTFKKIEPNMWKEVLNSEYALS